MAYEAIHSAMGRQVALETGIKAYRSEVFTVCTLSITKCGSVLVTKLHPRVTVGVCGLSSI